MAATLQDMTGAKTPLEAVTDPEESAKLAGLRYITDSEPGIRRKGTGKGFRYIDADGRPIRNTDDVKRIKSLAIPPAWTDVWISPNPRGHIQATGRDARGRKQYRYHPKWRELRDETKFFRLIAFAETLCTIRRRTDEDLGEHCLARDRLLATAVQILDETAIRVGNEEYARDNRSFGLTTLQRRHVKVTGSTIHLHFRGKSGKVHDVDVRDRRLARAIRRCEEIPGQELFQYVDDGEPRRIESTDVNDYLRQITDQDFTAKDFRTWHGTVSAACRLAEIGPARTQTEAKHNVVRAIEATADFLGNTPAIARKSYVHPGVIESYLDGSFQKVWQQGLRKEPEDAEECLYREERATLALLRTRLVDERPAAASA